jgi:hypothetical protein
MHKIVHREEMLFRAAKNLPTVWDDEKGRPSSALFKDSKGLSVDRDGGRTKEAITQSFKDTFGANQLKAVVYLEAGFCYDLETEIYYLPISQNKYHAEIHNSNDRPRLTQSKAKKMAENCVIINL